MLMNTDIIQINSQIFSTVKIMQMHKNENLQDWEKGIYEFILNWFDDSVFILQKTSGSTGEPKEIKLKKSAMIKSAQNTINFFDLQPGNTAWLCLPIDYIAGKMMVVRALVGKLNLLISEPAGTPKIPKQSIDFTAMVPLQLKKLFDAKTEFSQIKKLIVGGAEVDYQLQRALQKIPTKVFSTYGMTETCSHIALQRINGINPEKTFHLLPDITISRNEEGCLRIYAPHLAASHIQTTDLVEIVNENEFIWLGRADNVINTGGIKISPEQLEKEISQLIGAECLIIPQKDEFFGEKLVLVLEHSTEKAADLINRLRENLDSYHCPKAVRFTERFPRNESMKIDRRSILADIGRKLI
jgi:O-succinylbenzoic acid--CoA ligase